MPELPYERVSLHLERLGLVHSKASFAATLQRAEQAAWGHIQLLDRLLEEEIAAREERRVKNALKLAAFPFLQALDAFDFAFQPSLERARIMDLAALGFVQRKENVLFLGPPGVGKTHLAIALAIQACQHGVSVSCTPLDQLIRALTTADRAGKLPQKLKSFPTKSPLLVVDEVGYFPWTRVEANYLFQVVTARSERSSLLLTAKKTVTEWPEVFGDPAIATAILERLLPHAHIFSIKGNSSRLRERLLQTTPPPSDGLSPLRDASSEGR